MFGDLVFMTTLTAAVTAVIDITFAVVFTLKIAFQWVVLDS